MNEIGIGCRGSFVDWPPLFCTECNSFNNPEPTYVSPTHRAIYMLEDDSDSIYIEYLCNDCSNDYRASEKILVLSKIEDCAYENFDAVRAFVQMLDGNAQTTLSNRSKIT